MDRLEAGHARISGKPSLSFSAFSDELLGLVLFYLKSITIETTNNANRQKRVGYNITDVVGTVDFSFALFVSLLLALFLFNRV